MLKILIRQNMEFLINKRERAGLENLMILKLLQNTAMIWMIFIKILKNIISIKISKY